MNHRKDLVLSFTMGRSESTKDLKVTELISLIEYLKTFSDQNSTGDFMQGDIMRKRILSLCHQYGWTRYDAIKNSNFVDFIRLNNWMEKFSYLHKSLNSYKYNELPKLVTQFENVIVSYLTAK